jgi:hypothetical protein
MAFDKTIVLERLSKAFPQYRFEIGSYPDDFEGHHATIDVFGIPLAEQRTFLRESRKLRDDLEWIMKERPLFVFRKS